MEKLYTVRIKVRGEKGFAKGPEYLTEAQADGTVQQYEEAGMEAYKVPMKDTRPTWARRS